MIRLRRVRVIDFHTHFQAANPEAPPPTPRHPLLVEYDRQRGARMAEEWDHGVAEPAARGPAAEDMLLDRWSAEVERYDLGHVLFLTGSTHENLSRQVRRRPERFSGLVWKNPADPDALEVIRHGVEELGLRGLKFFGPRVDRPFEDPAMRPVWQYLAERRLPFLCHFGLLGRAGGLVYARNMSPLTIWPVAREFCDMPIVVPHFGCGYPQELLQLCWSVPNVYVDTSGSNQWMRWLPYPFDLEAAFRKYYELVGPERIVFGTDSSWFPRGFSYRYLQDQYRVCKQLNFSETDIEQIFSRNAARLLHLDAALYERAGSDQ